MVCFASTLHGAPSSSEAILITNFDRIVVDEYVLNQRPTGFPEKMGVQARLVGMHQDNF